MRFGDIPKDKRSVNWAENYHENGVSAVSFLNEITQNKNTVYDVIYGMQDIKKNIIGGWDLDLYGSDGEPLLTDPVIIVPFSEINSIKKADAVTYDDKGNIIPLSERFNPKNDDIRYSSSSDYQEYLDRHYAPNGTGKSIPEIRTTQRKETVINNKADEQSAFSVGENIDTSQTTDRSTV